MGVDVTGAEQSVQAGPEGPARSGGWLRIGLVVAGVAVLLVVAAVVVRQLRAGESAAAAPGHSEPYPGVPNGRTAAPGWRLVSSLGLEIEVPADWATNAETCGSADRATVLRGVGAVDLCGTVEPPDVPVAELVSYVDDLPAGYARRTVTVDGVATERADGHLADGRAEAVLTFPDLGARLLVRGTGPALTERILAGAHRVAVDSLGCATARPTTLRPPAPAGLDTLVPADANEIDVCYYGEPDYDLPNSRPVEDALKSSVAITAAAELAGALNAGTRGRNPDSRACLAVDKPIRPDAVLLFRTAGGPVVPVYVTSSGCWSRGFDNGARVVQATEALVAAAYNPLHTGYGLTGDLPGLPGDGSSGTPKPDPTDS